MLAYVEKYFRIFIDAATLKQVGARNAAAVLALFPHLYRCGHIEAVRPSRLCLALRAYFRIFIDAATLKPVFQDPKINRPRHFRIFIDAATLKPVESGLNM